MGINDLIPYLRKHFASHILMRKSPNGIEAKRKARVLIVDFMANLFMLNVTGTRAAVTARITGEQAFSTLMRPVFEWLFAPTTDADSALPPDLRRVRRAILIADKPEWVTADKQRTQERRRARTDADIAKACVAGTYQAFRPGSIIGFTDAGVVLRESPSVAIPFDPFSVLQQREARCALLAYLRRRLASHPFPPHVEVVVDFDTDEPLVCGGDPHPGAATCAMPQTWIGHAHCAGARALAEASAPPPRPSTAALIDAVVDLDGFDPTEAARVASGGVHVIGAPIPAPTAESATRQQPAYTRFRRPAFPRAGEGEILAVQYAAQLMRTLDTAARNVDVILRTDDSDVFAIACMPFWVEARRHGMRILWEVREGDLVDLGALYEDIRRRFTRASPESVILACINMGCDFVDKSALTKWIGVEAIWDAVVPCAFLTETSPLCTPWRVVRPRRDASGGGVYDDDDNDDSNDDDERPDSWRNGGPPTGASLYEYYEPVWCKCGAQRRSAETTAGTPIAAPPSAALQRPVVVVRGAVATAACESAGHDAKRSDADADDDATTRDDFEVEAAHGADDVTQAIACMKTRNLEDIDALIMQIYAHVANARSSARVVRATASRDAVERRFRDDASLAGKRIQPPPATSKPYTAALRDVLQNLYYWASATTGMPTGATRAPSDEISPNRKRRAH